MRAQPPHSTFTNHFPYYSTIYLSLQSPQYLEVKMLHNAFWLAIRSSLENFNSPKHPALLLTPLLPSNYLSYFIIMPCLIFCTYPSSLLPYIKKFLRTDITSHSFTRSFSSLQHIYSCIWIFCTFPFPYCGPVTSINIRQIKDWIEWAHWIYRLNGLIFVGAAGEREESVTLHFKNKDLLQTHTKFLLHII